MFNLLKSAAMTANVQVINISIIVFAVLLIIMVSALIIIGIILFKSAWFSRRISAVKAFRSRIFVRKFMGSEEVQKIVVDSGYLYDPKQDIFFSVMNPWQREFGYCRKYDELCPLFGMIVDSEPIYFYYGGKNWLIEFWKGQYDLTCGCEVGIYTLPGEKLEHPEEAHYNSASNSDRLFLSCVLEKNNKTLLVREEKHWWLTGFILAEFSEPADLEMDISIVFKNREMRDAFLDGLVSAGYKKPEFYITRNTVKIYFHKPHSEQPFTRTPVTDSIVQEKNFLMCKEFVEITSSLSKGDMESKMQAIHEKSPKLLYHILNMGRNKKLFEKGRRSK